MKKGSSSVRAAERIWGKLPKATRAALRQTVEAYGVSVTGGDLQYLDGRWYVTHAGLLRVARRNRCAGMQVQPALEFCDPGSSRWAFKATVYRSPTCKGFVGYGDADSSNVSPIVRGAEMRVAETRAVNRALRKAYGIGICSVEEMGSFSGPLPPAAASQKPVAKAESANGNGNHPLRDRLRLLIRQHKLDAALVKQYAADFCGTKILGEASREAVAGFIDHLAARAAEDRESLMEDLAHYAPPPPPPRIPVSAAPLPTQKEVA